MSVKIGDTVQLKSGGPLMTVVRIEADGAIACMWYAPDAEEFRSQAFVAAALDEVILEDDEDEDDED